MKKLILIIVILAFAKAYPQQSPKTIVSSSVKQMVEDFFVAFHQQDVEAIENMFHADASLHSVIITDSENQVKTESLENFISSLKSIPSDISFKEELHDILITENDYTATAITPYTFSVNEIKSHSGNNIFVFIKVDDFWKIMSITDSRVYD